MGRLQNLITPLHTSTARDYLGRMQDEKVHCMETARRYGPDYWDGDRRYGYGGYAYDGRWLPVARRFAAEYGLGPGASILDAACGKAFLLHELGRVLPDARLAGFDVSQHALDDARPELAGRLRQGRLQDPWPYPDKSFDLVLCINSLHNLEIFELKTALAEMQRVGRQAYLCVESYRNARELFNLQCWALTCEAFFSRQAWEWLLAEFGYTGDYEFIYFE